MNVPQLKLLAGLVRGLLEQHNVPIGHSQSLDVIAALPGLRNWPEVMAFPDRVVATELNTTSTIRLAYRLKSRYQLDLAPSTLLKALAPPDVQEAQAPPEIWPSGPRAGVYIATSQDAINALLANYSEASDGALVYAERAGDHWEGSIDLDEQGLWSRGLQRVPSGTLLVLGPLHLNQQSWDDCASRLRMACIRALDSGHRVAVLMDTPTPEDLLADVQLAVDMRQEEGEDCTEALMGIVTEDGELLRQEPFSPPRPWPTPVPNTATTDAIPAIVLPHLRRALRGRQAGLLVAGTSVIDDHWWAIDLVTSLLAVTQDMGMACRIMPRKRGTPAKDFMVPDPVKALPFLPSIETAYAQGYRRMIVAPVHSDIELLGAYADDVLFICGTHGADVAEGLRNVTGMGFFGKEQTLLKHLIAVFGVGYVEGRDKKTVQTCDMYVPGSDNLPPGDVAYGELMDAIRAQRVVRWEDQVGLLLDSKAITLPAVKKTFRRVEALDGYLAGRKSQATV
ncbi:hypothetical protein NU688_32430 [Variovorax sp. ZS18.2.2]|uniref:hypothetical protein n=1 Tax=Variovorax sp. ZS18.2.2 TaxID=2971255 RepID=UPI00215077DD|nr:hypothetical protein [Variovorax sp. ZS18.2.2]MCR6480903.1 hypothetical protein [Variovorax sp. ZS18.2.2]